MEWLANGKPPVSKTGAPERGLRVQVSSHSANLKREVWPSGLRRRS